MKTLIEIIKEHNLFKKEHMWGTDKEFLHMYVSAYYQNAFEPLQSQNIDLFEVGTCTGASLKMWKEFFINGKVSGVDIEDRRMEEYIDNAITYHHTNAYSNDFVNGLGEFDIIIDDGPHTLNSQIDFLNLYNTKLKANGIMVIEDIDSDNNIEVLSNHAETIFGKKANIIDNRSITNLSNEIILWIQK